MSSPSLSPATAKSPVITPTICTPAFPDILLMSTLTQKKLTPEQQRIVKAAIQASIEFEKAAWDKEIEKTRLAAVQPIYDGLKNKPRLYGLYQRIQIAKN
ncbi:transport system periplasmic binding protein [Salmonella enterica subsp. arizonae]|uniref:Transport system periplasmic binding protein n=1 Tax=Salmonella enterica subsp. arizonae TaxID=59203 RepID=A0A379TI81_SALER|nr:transport system periplasmic binding protein [Salmonella enterica subsp. arizonae]